MFAKWSHIVLGLIFYQFAFDFFWGVRVLMKPDFRTVLLMSGWMRRHLPVMDVGELSALKCLLVHCHCLKRTLTADIIASVRHIRSITALNCQKLSVICRSSPASAFPVWQGLISADDGWSLNIDLCRFYIHQNDPDACDTKSNSVLIRLMCASRVYNYLASPQF